MILFNWKRKSDGEPLAKIRTEHLLTRDQMACALLAYGHINPEDEDLPELTRDEVEKRIRHQLTWNREALDWWADNYQFEHREMLEEWAKRQAAKL